jgi:hypothetical protein
LGGIVVRNHVAEVEELCDLRGAIVTLPWKSGWLAVVTPPTVLD